VAYFDRRHPGWDVSPEYNWRFDFLCKTCAAAIVALTGAVLLLLLRGLGLGRAALPATLATMLGSDLWCAASQTLWQHGPAALGLTTTLWLLLPTRCAPWRLALAGFSAAAMVACRPTAAVFAVAVAAGVAWRRPRDLLPFLAAAAPVAALLAWYNLHFFGSLGGVYGHANWRPTPAYVLGALACTLVSPNRGLFIFHPWAALSLLTLPAASGPLRGRPVVVAALAAVPLHLAVISAWPCWWGGGSFGPRFWCEVIPLFGVTLGLGMSWAYHRRRWLLFAAFLASIVWSVGVQAVGVLCYPSTWNGSPVVVDDAPGRCWDWRDTELSRCLKEGIKPKAW
jgi:hypothetical protein